MSLDNLSNCESPSSTILRSKVFLANLEHSRMPASQSLSWSQRGRCGLSFPHMEWSTEYDRVSGCMRAVQHIRSLNNGLFNRKKKMETRRNQAWWSFFSFFSSFYPVSWLGKSFKNHQNLADISFEKRLTRCQVALHTSLVRDIYNVSRSAGHEVFSEEHVNFVWSNWQLCFKRWLFPAVLNMRFILYCFTVKW